MLIAISHSPSPQTIFNLHFVKAQKNEQKLIFTLLLDKSFQQL